MLTDGWVGVYKSHIKSNPPKYMSNNNQDEMYNIDVIKHMKEISNALKTLNDTKRKYKKWKKLFDAGQVNQAQMDQVTIQAKNRIQHAIAVSIECSYVIAQGDECDGDENAKLMAIEVINKLNK